ncbi:MAG: thiamine-phosphate synthase family protein [Methanomicrobiales archaeon]|nr:thiamine-phosphate synthase family protein [Methanomicrobiales archaeon]
MKDDTREDILKRLRSAVEMLSAGMDVRLIPEVGSNIVYALPGAKEVSDVAGVLGRIVRMAGRVHPVGDMAFGASDHMARAVLTAMRFDPGIRSAANIRFSEGILSILEGLMLEVRSFDRGREPAGIKTMDWGVAACCRDGVPDAIYDRGAMGKEPMIRLFGEDPVQVAENIIKISTRIKDTHIVAGTD